MAELPQNSFINLPMSFLDPIQGSEEGLPAASNADVLGDSGGFFDHVLFALTGTPDSMLTPEEQGERAKKRNEAGDSARAATMNPGEEYMWAPSTGGSQLDLSQIIRLVGSVAGAG